MTLSLKGHSIYKVNVIWSALNIVWSRTFADLYPIAFQKVSWQAFISNILQQFKLIAAKFQ